MFFGGQDIIRLPRLFRFLQRPLAQLISVLRAPKSKEGYAAIGGGSPLRKITDEQASALKMALETKEVPANVYVAMRYWHPFTEEAVHQVGLKCLLFFPLAVTSVYFLINSLMLSMSSLMCLDLYLAKLNW